MTRSELDALIAALIKMRNEATDETALDAMAAYPTWKPNTAYAVNDRVRDNSILYKRVQSQTDPAAEIYAPHEALSIWQAISLEDGTIDHPITYAIGMAIELDKYYIENNILYRCIRDSGVPLYNNLADLVNIYVEVVIND